MCLFMQDTYRHQGMRRKLVDSLRAKGILDEQVLAAIGTLPRHFFLEAAFEDWAYEDKPFPIGCEQTISQPYTVAYQTELLRLKPRLKVLEVGTGSGYQAAILGLLKARVFTVERHKPLYEKARKLLADLPIGNVRCYHRDGYLGLAEFAPFDRILATAGADEVPPALLQQLAVGGILVIPVGTDKQRMQRITKTSNTNFQYEDLGDFRFVPFLKGMG